MPEAPRVSALDRRDGMVSEDTKPTPAGYSESWRQGGVPDVEQAAEHCRGALDAGADARDANRSTTALASCLP